MHVRALSALALSTGAPRHAPCAALDAGSKVAVVGSGPVAFLTARLAALQGYTTTLMASAADVEYAQAVMYDVDQKALDLQALSLSGPNRSPEALESAIKGSEGLIFALDKDWTFTEEQLDNFLPREGSTNVQHVCLMSRNLNGEGMGFWCNAAKRAANPDIWAAGKVRWLSNARWRPRAAATRLLLPKT